MDGMDIAGTEYTLSSSDDNSMELSDRNDAGSLSDGASMSQKVFSDHRQAYSTNRGRSRSLSSRRKPSHTSSNSQRSRALKGMESEETLILEKFNFERLNSKNGLYLLLGKRNTGKTTWCRFINQHIQASRDGFVVLITQNERLKENWSHHIPKLFIFQPEDANIMSTISKCMNNAIKSCENRGISSHDDRLRLTFILDDVGSESSVMNNAGLKKLASNGRHVNITVFILAQFLYQVPPKVRSQFEYIFMLASISQKNNKTVHQEFVAHVEYSRFCKILQRSTENHGVLVINTTSSQIHDSLYFSQIDTYPIKTVRLGCWVQWVMNHFLYNEEETFDDFCQSENSEEESSRTRKEQEKSQDVMVIDLN